MQKDTQATLEPTDPVAHPHYPHRLPRAAALTYRVETQPAEDLHLADIDPPPPYQSAWE